MNSENTYALRIARHNAQVVVASKVRNQVYIERSVFVFVVVPESEDMSREAATVSTS